MDESLYLRDPQSSRRGLAILSGGIIQMDAMGFEKFTFKRLAQEIGSTEATIYRYFENKHHLLQYLVGWYWTLVSFKIDFALRNIAEPMTKLRICLQVLSHTQPGLVFDAIEEAALRRIVISELDKIYLTKKVDKDYKDGALAPFRDACKKIADIIKEVDPHYPFPNSLTSSAVHASVHQVYFTKHLPVLSDFTNDPQRLHQNLHLFLESFVLNALHRRI
ncbi:MAG TPA: helix-turn-helix domain-containing protein [Cyclobacteriaceae bacterium]|nr:helix-turn-helix domain-containing protein [Cyclobacteriaceae bacterium]